MASPVIRRLHLQRFRGVENLVWQPATGMNVILGGGNVGKTTLLDAVALLLHPTNGYTLSDADYWQREVDAEFIIEAVMSLPEETGIHKLGAPAWPWEWDGVDAVQPQVDGECGPQEAVYKVRVRGTSDLELVHEIVQPDGAVIAFSTFLRRGIGVVRLVGDDRNDRDLRLIQGGGLDRLLADKTLRAKLGRKVALNAVEAELTLEAQQRLTALDTKFGERALPTGLGLGFVGGPGVSIGSLVGLTSKKDAVPLPLTSWGSGTRRLAALAVADTLQEGMPITVVDELERGLEPYRQHRLVHALQDKGTQIFVTTHSTSIISASTASTLWYVDVAGAIGQLPAAKIKGHQKRDPETFLARLSIVVEGITEAGFVEALLDRYAGSSWRDEGIHVTDGGGNDTVLELLEALSSGGLRFAGFADVEPANPNPGRWGKVKERLGDLLLRWDKGCLEENLIPLFGVGQLQALLQDAEGGRTGMRLRSLADRLGIDDATFEAVSAAAGATMMQTVIQAATGAVPDSVKDDKARANEYKAHARVWFKSKVGGRELARKLLDLQAWPKARPLLLPFLNAVRASLGKDALPDDQQ
jgi:putative ATP-dependent endonuclease of OLD family